MSRATPANNVSREDWDRWKEYIIDFIKHDKHTTRDLASHMADEHGFIATDRMYKARFREWGVDNKKIRHPVWCELSKILASREAMGKESMFSVTVLAGRKELTPENIRKQVRRNPNLKFDERSQREHERQIRQAEIDCWTPEPQPRTRFSFHDSQHEDEDASPTPSDDYSATSTHPRTPDDVIATPSGSRSNAWSSVHAVAPFLGTGQPMLEERRNIPSHPGPPPAAPLLDADLADVLQKMSLTSYGHGAIDARIASYVGHPTGYVPFRQLDQAAVNAGRWLLSHIAAALHEDAGEFTLANTRREAARAVFQEMLSTDNRFILPGLNLMTSLMTAHGHEIPYQSFLRDCCEVIEQKQGAGLPYGLPFQYSRAEATGDKAGIQRLGAGLQRSRDQCRLIWQGESSPNYLVHSYFWAWHLLDLGQADEVVNIMRDLLPRSEHFMGKRHLVTVNCLAILSIAYANSNRHADAMTVVADAVERCRCAVGPTNQYTLRLLRKLAHMQRQSGLLVDAERNLRQVLAGRRAFFGLDCGHTWGAISDVEGVLNEQGKHDEARRHRQHFETRMPPFNADEWARIDDEDWIHRIRPAYATNAFQTLGNSARL